MEYRPGNPGTIGVDITFPDPLHLPAMRRMFGSYSYGNIERLELNALILGMQTFLEAYASNEPALRSVSRVIFVTDRLGLSDQNRTNAYRIRQWRHDKWRNFEGKPILNADLLEALDKARRKIATTTNWAVAIEFQPSKYNRQPHKLAKAAKGQPPAKSQVALKGLKIGKRLHGESEVDYKMLRPRDQLSVRVYFKRPIQDQWAISAEITNGHLAEKKITIYAAAHVEQALHRQNHYQITIREVFTHHITIEPSPQRLLTIPS